MQKPAERAGRSWPAGTSPGRCSHCPEHLHPACTRSDPLKPDQVIAMCNGSVGLRLEQLLMAPIPGHLIPHKDAKAPKPCRL